MSRAVLRAAGITLEKFFVFGIGRQLDQLAEHGLGHRALGEFIIICLVSIILPRRLSEVS